MSCREVVALIEDNKLALALLGTAMIVTMPEPGAPLRWRTLYQWIFDGVHQFLNMRRPMPPVETPAKPKE